MNLPLAGLSVLEVGAGTGDHTGFFVDRGCAVTSTEARPENLSIIRDRFPDLSVKQLDMDRPDGDAIDAEYDIVYCYGLLYQLGEEGSSSSALRPSRTVATSVSDLRDPMRSP